MRIFKVSKFTLLEGFVFFCLPLFIFYCALWFFVASSQRDWFEFFVADLEFFGIYTIDFPELRLSNFPFRPSVGLYKWSFRIKDPMQKNGALVIEIDSMDVAKSLLSKEFYLGFQNKIRVLSMGNNTIGSSFNIFPSMVLSMKLDKAQKASSTRIALKEIEIKNGSLEFAFDGLRNKNIKASINKTSIKCNNDIFGVWGILGANVHNLCDASISLSTVVENKIFEHGPSLEYRISSYPLSLKTEFSADFNDANWERVNWRLKTFHAAVKNSTFSLDFPASGTFVGGIGKDLTDLSISIGNACSMFDAIGAGGGKGLATEIPFMDPIFDKCMDRNIKKLDAKLKYINGPSLNPWVINWSSSN